MKRIIALLLLICLALCACGQSNNESTTPPTTTEATTNATTEPTTEPTEPPMLYQNPLTGEPMATLYTERPVAVVINNIKACLPQYGISFADIIYEFEAEGGVTRLLAIYTDLKDAEKIGPIRSDRTYFNNISASYDIPLVHCGGSDKALAGMYDASNKLTKWDHINQMSNGSYFYRDTERRQQGYAYEHTLFSIGEKLIAAIKKKKYNVTYEDGTNYGLQFSDDVALNGETANVVTVTFRGKKFTKFTYNEDLGLYEAYQLKTNHIDKLTGKTMAYRNVIVLQAKQTFMNTGKNRTYYDLIGSGNGFFACDGKIVPIKWSRSAVDKNFVYTLEDGTPLTLGVGTSYIGVIGNSGSAGVSHE